MNSNNRHDAGRVRDGQRERSGSERFGNAVPFDPSEHAEAASVLLTEMISVQGVARKWDLKEATVREFERNGKLPKAIRIGKKLLFRVAELNRLVDGDES